MAPRIPSGPNKFEPGTKAKPAPEAVPGRTTGVEKRRAAERKKKKQVKPD